MARFGRVACILAAAASLIAAAPPEQAGDAIPAAPLQQAALDASYAYLAAKDRGDYAAAYRSIDADMRAYLTPDLYREETAKFNAGAGAPEGRRVVRLTWYRDPPEAKRPGLYVAADFVSRFSGLALHCGYLMWRVDGKDSFRLVREEQNFLDAATAKQMPPERFSAVPRQLGCLAPPA